MMQMKFILLGFTFFILLIFGCFLFFSIDETPIQDFVHKNQSTQNKEGNSKQIDLSKKEMTTGKTNLAKSASPIKQNKQDELSEKIIMDQDDPAGEQPESEPQYPDTVEGIKAQIYSKNIEDIEQIGLLDDLVQTGDVDTKEFWGDDWASVDDWKKKTNGFKLEKNDNGDLIFSPDEQTSRTYTFFENPQAYTYDEENKEFVNEVDFYGKTIYNVAKFINDDVLVMMTISGRKVDLNIYQKSAAQ